MNLQRCRSGPHNGGNVAKSILYSVFAARAVNWNFQIMKVELNKIHSAEVIRDFSRRPPPPSGDVRPHPPSPIGICISKCSLNALVSAEINFWLSNNVTGGKLERFFLFTEERRRFYSTLCRRMLFATFSFACRNEKWFLLAFMYRIYQLLDITLEKYIMVDSICHCQTKRFGYTFYLQTTRFYSSGNFENSLAFMYRIYLRRNLL